MGPTGEAGVDAGPVRAGFAAGEGARAHGGRDGRLRLLVRTSFEESRHRYGSPRIHRDLLEQDIRVSRKRVIRLMQEEGLEARVRKRFKCTTMSDHDQPVAANLWDREFRADTVNQRDTTEFVIGESGKLYLAAILDLFSRFVVGWATRHSLSYDHSLLFRKYSCSALRCFTRSALGQR